MWKPVLPADASRFKLTGGRLLPALLRDLRSVVPGEADRPREGDPEASARLDLLGPLPLASLGRGRHGDTLPETIAADLLIEQGRIAKITPPGGLAAVAVPETELDDGLILPGFVDVHTHLDKALVWPRRQNRDGTFASALEQMTADRLQRWTAADLRRRMEFALRCAYAHGTVALRTHLDSIDEQTRISWRVFEELRCDWHGRIKLQAVSLFPAELALDESAFTHVLRTVSEAGGVLGAFVKMVPGLPEALDRIFRAAAAHGLDLDFHVDETMDPQGRSLAVVAETALRHRFAGKILAGHCCSLATQADDAARRTMDRVAKAGIGIVALPMCNLYLMDREPGRTPRRRGITLLHELKARGIAVMVASDNIRDPFYAYGDLDMLEVFRESARIAHLDAPFADWPALMSSAPAAQMRLDGVGAIHEGGRADLVLCGARTLNELLSRPQADRIVLRDGRPISRALPDYRELDDLMAADAEREPLTERLAGGVAVSIG